MRSEIGIIYSAPMVLARKAGRKSQTRRPVRIAKVYEPDFGKPVLDKAWIDTSYLKPACGNVPCLKIPFDGNGQKGMETTQRHFPKWEPRDLLWTRETHTIMSWKRLSSKFQSVYRLTGYYTADRQKFQICLTVAESRKFHRRQRQVGTIPAIFMYRSLSRFQDVVTKVRVERVQQITEKDAKAEGVPDRHDVFHPSLQSRMFNVHTRNYAALWDSIHGRDAWDRNDWVWIVEFKPAPKRRRPKRWLDRRKGARR